MINQVQKQISVYMNSVRKYIGKTKFKKISYPSCTAAKTSCTLSNVLLASFLLLTVDGMGLPAEPVPRNCFRRMCPIFDKLCRN